MALVLPTLTAWTSSRLTAVLTAKTQADFTTAFDALFARNVNVVYNGKQLARDQYKAQLLSQSSAAIEEQGASVSVQGQLDVPGDQGQLVSNHFISCSITPLKTFTVRPCWSILHIPC
jgi:hypothetical protein